MNKKLKQKRVLKAKETTKLACLGIEPGRPPVCEARITTVLCGSQLPISLSFYVIQEETYVRRIPSEEEETKAEPNPNATFAC